MKTTRKSKKTAQAAAVATLQEVRALYLLLGDEINRMAASVVKEGDTWNWGHVGEVDHLKSQLTEILAVYEQAYHESESEAQDGVRRSMEGLVNLGGPLSDLSIPLVTEVR